MLPAQLEQPPPPPSPENNSDESSEESEESVEEDTDEDTDEDEDEDEDVDDLPSGSGEAPAASSNENSIPPYAVILALDEGPGSHVFSSSLLFSNFNEKTLSLKNFFDAVEGCSLGQNVELPSEQIFRALIASHASETLVPNDEKNRILRLYVLYLLSVHRDNDFVSACVEYVKRRRFEIRAFEILPIYVNFGCTLKILTGSNDLDFPVKFRNQVQVADRERRFPYLNLEMVADVLLYYASLGLIRKDEELKVLLRALTRVSMDRKIACSRILSTYSQLISVISSQLAPIYDHNDIVSCLHLPDEDVMNRAEFVLIVHLPICPKLHELLLLRTINFMLNGIDSAIGDTFGPNYIFLVLQKMLHTDSVPLDNVFCIFQLLNSSLPNCTATELEASHTYTGSTPPGKVRNRVFSQLAKAPGGNGSIKTCNSELRFKEEPGDIFEGYPSAVKRKVAAQLKGKGASVERKMVDFLRELSVFILPLGMGSKRLDFFAEQVKKYSGKVKDKSVATHVIIDESVGEDKEKCLMALKTYGIVLSAGVKFVGTKWLSKCFAAKTLIDPKSFEFDWIEKELERLNSNSDQDGNKNSDGKEFLQNRDESSPKKKAKIEPEKSLCSQSSAPNRVISTENKLIIDELQKLADAFAARNDTWRAYSYRNAVSAVARHNKDITSFQEACKIPGIGERMALKIIEILESGRCGKVQEIVDEKTKVLERFCNIWGVGPCTAENWYHLGLRTLEDLKEKAKLNKQQEIGLNFYEDFLQRMTREDAERIAGVVENELKEISSRCRMELVGSYRRGKTTCGDVDIMVVNPGPKYPLEILLQLTDKLRRKGYLTHDLVELDDSCPGENNHRKYMGVFKFPCDREIHRRIDIFVVPESEYAPGLMHYTGSAMFNRSIRLFASRRGLTLNEHGLYSGIIRKGSDIVNEGELVPTPTEQDIFNYLGLEYKLPEERDH